MKKCKFLSAFLALLLCCTFLFTPVMAKSSGIAKGYENVTQTWTETIGDPLSGKSDFYTRDLLYDKATNKQFITVQGRDGNIFYIVIDYDAQIDDDEEKYMVYFLNQVDETDLSALIDAENKPPALCSCTEKCATASEKSRSRNLMHRNRKRQKSQASLVQWSFCWQWSWLAAVQPVI